MLCVIQSQSFITITSSKKPLHLKADLHSKSNNQNVQHIAHATRSVILLPNCGFIFSAISLLEICNFSKLGAVQQRKVRAILVSNCFKTNLSLNNLHFRKAVMLLSQIHGDRYYRVLGRREQGVSV